MNSNLLERIQHAMHSDDKSLELEKIIIELKGKGWTQKQVHDLFSEAFIHYRDNGTEEQYNVLADIMDRIVGWGNNKHCFFDTFLKT